MPTDGLGSDAGRRSLTELGEARARASRREACKACGAYFAPGTVHCPNCGVRLRLTFAVVRRRAVPSPAATSADAPGAPAQAKSGPTGSGVAAVAAATGPRAAWLLHGERPRRADLVPGYARAWGERLVAWSAVGIFVALTLSFVDHIEGFGDESLRALAPTPVARRAAIARVPAADTSLPSAHDEPPGDTTDASLENADVAPRLAPHMLPRPAPRPLRSVRKPESVPSPRPDTATMLAAADALAAAAAPPPAAAPRTRWETMRDDIAQCAKRGFFEGVVCEQRVRVRYCDGWWGRSPECPSGRMADYGN